MSKSGIVNVRMVITEEKILLNIEKVQKMINPNSKKQIVKLEEDTFFKDLIESIKTYLIEYPKKKNFPSDVYKAAYGLVEFATNQFEENTKKIEDLIRQREENIVLAGLLKDTIEAIENKDEDWKAKVREVQGKLPEDAIDTLSILIKCKNKDSQTYMDSIKILNAKVNNLESNLHIEIDMERIEDRSKALSYIGIEVADALKTIPAPVENTVKVEKVEEIKEVKEQKAIEQQTQQQYIEETTFEAKPSLWQRVKNCKLIRAIRYVTKIRIVVKYPDALPEGRGEN
ncbi:MAG: hypothetical protein HFJ59_04385 [Clostridia bacterium]|nr:hypothetical protein [Clostridia bacterium]